MLKSLVSSINGLLSWMIRVMVRGYQIFLSPWLGPRCRYQPTCSQYALLAVERYGPWRGSWLAIRRLLRCHPWSKGGWDPP